MLLAVDVIDPPRAYIYKRKRYEMFPWTFQNGLNYVEVADWETAVFLADLFRKGLRQQYGD